MKTKQQKFNNLQEIWYKKLKDSGFEDLEEPRVGNNDKSYHWLKQWHNQYFQQRYTPSQFDAKQDYFILASRFLFEHKFENTLEKNIWKLHSEGEYIRETAKKLGTYKLKVESTLKKLKKIMFEREKVNG